MSFPTNEVSVTVMRRDLNEDFFTSAYQSDQVAWDIETTGLDWRVEEIGTCQIFVPGTGVAIVQLDGSVPERLRDLLTTPSVTKVFHHAPFDLRFMAHQWKARPARIACTKVAAKITCPGLDKSEYSLKPLARRVLDIDLDKSQQRSNWLRATLSQQQLAYAAADVLFLLPLLQELLDQAQRSDLVDLVEASFAYLPVRVELDLAGAGDVFAY